VTLLTGRPQPVMTASIATNAPSSRRGRPSPAMGRITAISLIVAIVVTLVLLVGDLMAERPKILPQGPDRVTGDPSG
jgi:hypothetical protein